MAPLLLLDNGRIGDETVNLVSSFTALESSQGLRRAGGLQ
jgi:hypothetical protein